MRRLAPFGPGFVLALAVGCSGDDSGYVEPEFAEQEVNVGPAYTLVGVQSNKCVQFANTNDLAEAQISTCDGSTRQQWRFENIETGYYRVRNVASNKCLDVEGVSTAVGARILQWSCSSTGLNQRWKVEEISGVARLIARHSNLPAEVSGGATANGTRLVQGTTPTTSRQQFRATLVGSGGTGGTGGTTGSGGTTSQGGTTTQGGTTSQGGTTTQGGTTSQGGTTTGGTGGRTTFPCDGNTSGYNATVVKSGSTWTAKRGTTTLLTTTDTRAAIQAAVDGLTAGRTTKHSVLVQGDGDIAATARVSLPSFTIINVCGALNATGAGSGDNAPLYAKDKTDIQIPNVKIRGTPSYGLFFRNTHNLHLGNVDIRVSSGLGVRIDDGTGDHSLLPDARNIRIDTVYVEGTGTQGVETYGVDGLTVGTVTARRVAHSGLLLNQTVNATIGTVDATDAGTGTGYAAFRMANRNGRINNAYPTNIRVGNVIARGGGRGIFCVSESGGAVIDRVQIENTGNNSILIENCYNVTIAGVSGTIVGGGDVRLAARTEFPNSYDIFLKNLTLTTTKLVESPCATNSTFTNITHLNGSTRSICP